MILVDSSVFIALADARDQWHGAAKALIPSIEHDDIVVSDLIIAEVVTEIGRRAGGKEGMKLYHYFTDNCAVVYGDESMIQSAMKIFLRYDGSLSLSDALSVQIMETTHTRKILSFNSDFDKIKGIERIS